MHFGLARAFSAARNPRHIAALLGFIWFLQIGGGPALNPLNTQWLFSGDWFQHWLGWLLFRNEPWSFPVGTITAMPYPIGTTIGFTDSNPLVSIALKPLSAWLPAEFQFIGPWLALCFVLQGYMGAALVSTVTEDAGQQVLGGYLLVLSPVIVARLGHDTLCAHWLLLGMLYLGLRTYGGAESVRRGLRLAVLGVLIASTIHPYLALMSWAIGVSVCVRLLAARLIGLAQAGWALVAMTLGALVFFYVLGYFGGANLGLGGFGMYGADLLTLVNPVHFSRMLPPIPRAWSNLEGFGFLGLGGGLAAALALAASLRRRPALRPGTWPVIVACALMAVFAMASDVTVAGRHLLDLRWLYAPVSDVVAPFRSSGRFIWAFHYLTIAFGVWGLTHITGPGRRSAGTLLLAIAVAVQAADLQIDTKWAQPKKMREAPIAPFTLAQGKYHHLALVPMQVLDVCADPYDDEQVYRFMLHAYRLKMTYNSGKVSRFASGTIRQECDRQDRTIADGQLDSETIYVVMPAEVQRFKAIDAACGRWDGFWFCVSRASNPRFASYIETGKDPGG